MRSLVVLSKCLTSDILRRYGMLLSVQLMAVSMASIKIKHRDHRLFTALYFSYAQS